MITPYESKEVEKEANRLESLANIKAGELRDLVEKRLLADWENITSLAEETYEACQAWHKKHQEFIRLKSD